MDHLQPRSLSNLHGAGTAACDHSIHAALPDLLKQVLSDLHGKIVILFFQTKGPGQPAAAVSENLNLKPGDEFQEFNRLFRDTQGPEMAGIMISNLQGNLSQLGVELPLLF